MEDYKTQACMEDERLSEVNEFDERLMEILKSNFRFDFKKGYAVFNPKEAHKDIKALLLEELPEKEEFDFYRMVNVEPWNLYRQEVIKRWGLCE